MSKKRSKRKKINNLNFSECKEILDKLSGQEHSLYYKHVVTRFNELTSVKDIKYNTKKSRDWFNSLVHIIRICQIQTNSLKI